jgi:hypothetical protein
MDLSTAVAFASSWSSLSSRWLPAVALEVKARERVAVLAGLVVFPDCRVFIVGLESRLRTTPAPAV